MISLWRLRGYIFNLRVLSRDEKREIENFV